MSDMPASPVSRRTQKQRRDATRERLLAATLRCLGRMGYASTSVTAIVKEAGVSRGALLHHFPNKVDLVAAAIDHFYVQRLERFKERLLGAEGERLALRQRLEVLREDFRTWFPVGFEIIMAVRTNEDLRQAYDALVQDQLEPMSQIYEQFFPEFAGARSPRTMIAVVGAFLRGLALEDMTSNDERVDEVFDLFVDMLDCYHDRALPDGAA